MPRPALIAIAILLVAAAVAYFVLGRGGGEPEPVPEPPAPAEPAAVEPEAVTEPAMPLPDLAASDEFARGVGAQLGLAPELTQGIGSGVVASIVRIVDTVASGQVPRRDLGFLSPEGEYPTAEEGEILVVDPAGYTRFDAVAQTIESLDARSVVSSFEVMEPLLDQAFSDIGGGDTLFRERMLAALDVLLAAPVIEGQPGLVDVAVDRFEYREPELEALQPVQKQLLRMGPGNQRRIQARLQQIRDLLGVGD